MENIDTVSEPGCEEFTCQKRTSMSEEEGTYVDDEEIVIVDKDGVNGEEGIDMRQARKVDSMHSLPSCEY